jgi:phosphatidylinositol dimannoside acyltransferase
VPGGRAAYLAYRAGAETARRLPVPLGRSLARVAARTMLRGWPQRRRQVARHLARVTDGSLAGADLDAATAAVFANYARYWHEMFRLDPESGAALQQTFELRGRVNLDAGIATERGVILALPHLGNWDVAGAWLAGRPGVPGVTVVAETVEPPELFEWFVATREALGMEVVPLGADAGAGVLRALRRRHVVCLVCDRDLGGEGVEVEFFGERTRVPAGPALLALRTGAPLLPSAAFFRDDGGHGADIGAPLHVERRGRLRDDVTRVTQDLALRFETLIRAAPEQWLMMQPVWPSDERAGNGTRA